jgi:hypothetical protein
LRVPVSIWTHAAPTATSTLMFAPAPRCATLRSPAPTTPSCSRRRSSSSSARIRWNGHVALTGDEVSEEGSCGSGVVPTRNASRQNTVHCARRENDDAAAARRSSRAELPPRRAWKSKGAVAVRRAAEQDRAALRVHVEPLARVERVRSAICWPVVLFSSCGFVIGPVIRNRGHVGASPALTTNCCAVTFSAT